MFESGLDGATIRIGIGAPADSSIEDARIKAQGYKKQVDNGIDPRNFETPTALHFRLAAHRRTGPSLPDWSAASFSSPHAGLSFWVRPAGCNDRRISVRQPARALLSWGVSGA